LKVPIPNGSKEVMEIREPWSLHKKSDQVNIVIQPRVNGRGGSVPMKIRSETVSQISTDNYRSEVNKLTCRTGIDS
jgi:hypothetical protein